MISHLHYPRDQSRYAPSPWETFLHCDDVSHWLVAYLDWSLSVMLINTAFSHSNEEYSPYFLVITHQTQARDDIDGLMQKRRNPITNALEYFFLALCHPYKECHLWVSTVHICTATNREYRIGTVDYTVIYFHHFQYLYWLLKSSYPVTQRWSIPRYVTDIVLLWYAVFWLSQDGGDGQVYNS